jgi:LAS superfamily LD-carboxypeptidase LdcB
MIAVEPPILSFDARVLETFSDVSERLRENNLFTPKLTLEVYRTFLNQAQLAVVEQILRLNPMDYGVKTPYAGELESVPVDLVVIQRQDYTENGELKTLDERYVPRHIYEAYERMNTAFTSEYPARVLLVGSCYRSPAYQIIVFIYILVHNYDGDIARTILQASPPAYSQHTIATKAAIDFNNIDGSPSDQSPEDFKQTIEYEWLRKHGNGFYFYESWTEDNEFGMRPEPWHLQYRA